MNDQPPEPITCHACGEPIPVDVDGQIVGHFGESEEGWITCARCSRSYGARKALATERPKKKRRGSATRRKTK